MMKARHGQIALYLVLVLVAITFLVVMNVGAYLAVSAKNKTTNAGDAAAIAVANYQGTLLNRIGQWNLDRLKAGLKGDGEQMATLFTSQLRCAFLDPIEGIRIGNREAKANGMEKDEGMQDILKQHVIDIRMVYLANPTVYPEPWKGAWKEYAACLESAIAEGIYAGPDNADFRNAEGGHSLLNRYFYDAIAGRNWCWFHFNALDLLQSYVDYHSWAPLPTADDETRQRKAVNSEIYSLNLCLKNGSAVSLLGKEILAQWLEVTVVEIENSPLLNDGNQQWLCYDANDTWRNWWEIDPDGPWQFPVVGDVRPEYDVRGCAAICRVTKHIPDVVEGKDDRIAVWSAAAKPLGTVEDENGDVSIVTAYNDFVLPSFANVRLVPLDSVGGKDLATADADWMRHVHDHLPKYMEDGPNELSDCYYCKQLVRWEHPLFRDNGARWIKYHAKEDCIRPSGPGPSPTGGTPHGH